MCAEVIFCSQGEGEDHPQQPLRKNVSNQHVAGFASYGGSEFLTTAYLKPPGKEEKTAVIFIPNLSSSERSTGRSVGRMSGFSYEEADVGVHVSAAGHHSHHAG